MGFRLAWYSTISTLAAGGVVISAFHQRPNFYSACIYLAQSNLCLMILTNLILLIYGTFVYSLQRVCFGALRPIEIEQLYEKGWFAVTETCLAMTIFREEVGAWFLVMFVALLTGKVWGWIGDGRVEILGQQPPVNPRLFHFRLSTSLAMSVIFDLVLMNYIIHIVIQQARPNMMVMFLFEFAILTTCSLSTACRYGISIMEAKVVKKQTAERIMELRREYREERAQIIRQRATEVDSQRDPDVAEPNVSLPSEDDDVDEMDIEVPGWETKGQWVLTLDLVTDFIKFGIYTSFFIVLLMFYGIPIHIVRDLLLTARSCMKRLAAFLRYRRATRDMNERYQDATAEDIQREDTCIICRENMRPWATTNPQPQPAAPTDSTPPTRPVPPVNERSRSKRLPCGHILHLGCLKSWLERQQVCPTCRRPVVDSQGQAARPAQNPGPGQGPAPQPDAAGGQQPAIGRAPVRGGGLRMLNLGIRVGFGPANLQNFARELGRPQAPPDNVPMGAHRAYGLELRFPPRARAQAQAQEQQQQQQQPPSGTVNAYPSLSLQEQLKMIETQILSELSALQLTQHEQQIINLLCVELERLRGVRNGIVESLAGNTQSSPTTQPAQAPSQQSMSTTSCHQIFQPSTTTPIPSGHADLPSGVMIPEGWSLLPLQSVDNIFSPQGTAIPSMGSNLSIFEDGLNASTTLNPINQSEYSTQATDSNNQCPSQRVNVGTSNPPLPGPSKSRTATAEKSSPEGKEKLKASSYLESEESLNSRLELNNNSNSDLDLPPPHIEDGELLYVEDEGMEKLNKDKGKSPAATVEDTNDKFEH